MQVVYRGYVLVRLADRGFNSRGRIEDRCYRWRRHGEDTVAEVRALQERICDRDGVRRSRLAGMEQAVRKTGTYINERPRIAFDLLVEPEDLPAYRVTKKATVPHTALGRIEPGDGFEALIDPEDEDSIAIDWDAPISGADGGPSERLKRLEQLRKQGQISDGEYEEHRRRILGSI